MILAVLIHSNSHAQNLIALQTNGVSTFYTNLPDALTNAQNGDTIYLPGGSFDAITISKRLHVIGVGHHPDSTNVTARSIVKGITINSGADNGSISGITLNNNAITFMADLNGFTITRCLLSGGLNFYNDPNISNISISENLLGTTILQGSNFSNFSMNNNIVIGQVGIDKSTIKNNIFLYFNVYGYNGYPLKSNNCVIENNFFVAYLDRNSSNCIYRNNVGGGVNGEDSYGNQGSNNYRDNGTLESIFINYYPATTLIGESIYKADFHLKPDSPYKNAGRDGTDIGIYGGAFPWKAGSIPANPHFQSLKVRPTTDSNGNLNVKIKVAAQDR